MMLDTSCNGGAALLPEDPPRKEETQNGHGLWVCWYSTGYREEGACLTGPEYSSRLTVAEDPYSRELTLFGGSLNKLEVLLQRVEKQISAWRWLIDSVVKNKICVLALEQI